MPREKIELAALTPGQLAQRWGVGVERIHALIQAGQLPGAFTIPSAGRFGETIKIPMESIRQAEQDWAVVPVDKERRRPPRSHRQGDIPTLQHFPELSGLGLEPAAECHASG